MAEVTVVFADFAGSTGVFESLGNAKATQAITYLTQWVSGVCESHGGLFVKYLGDGVLCVFINNTAAIDAALELQRVHQKRINEWTGPGLMRLQIGLARGEVVEQDADYYGDAVNVASRLSDLAGSDQILVTDSVISQLPPHNNVRSRSLGALEIRGRSELCVVHRIEWQSELHTEAFTMPAGLSWTEPPASVAPPSSVELSWLDMKSEFSVADLPIFLGRDPSAEFVIEDPRVSRRHARIQWRAGRFYFEDLSSYGSWIRFANNQTVVPLRRQECVLPLEGEIALGGPFDDFTMPTVSFKFHSGKLLMRTDKQTRY